MFSSRVTTANPLDNGRRRTAPRNRCTRERIDLLDSVLEISKDKVEITDADKGDDKTHKIAFDYEGSILSALKEELLLPSIRECKKFLQEVKSLDLLDPEHLRQRTRESSGTLAWAGRNFSAFLHEMSDQKRLELVSKLKGAYPQLQGFMPSRFDRVGSKLEISEAYEGRNRILSGDDDRGSTYQRWNASADRDPGRASNRTPLLVVRRDRERDQSRTGRIRHRHLVKHVQQVLVTTHSPMILNYLDDEMAKEGVIYLYKTPQGHTKSIPFFSIPSLQEKLTVMGPGEAFVDTNLTKLADEIADMPREEA